MLIVATVLYMLLAGLILTSGKHRSNWIFALIVACFSAWAFGMFIFLGAKSEAVAISGAQVFYVAAVFFSPLLFIFALEYPVKYHVQSLVYILIGISVAVLAGMMIVDRSLIITSMTRVGSDWVVHVNPVMYGIFSLHFVMYFIGALGVAGHTVIKNRGVVRQQALYYMTGILITSVPGFIVDLILPSYGDYSLIWVGPMCSVAFFALTLYSMNRYRMLNVKTFVAKGLTYGSIVISIAALYIGLLYLFSQFLVSVGLESVDTYALNIVVALIAAFTFQPLRSFFDKLTQQLLYRRNYDVQKVIDALTRACVVRTDLSSLSEEVFQILQTALNPRFIAIVFDVHHAALRSTQKGLAWLSSSADLERKHPSERAKRGIAATYRLKTASQDIGYLVIGEELDEGVYREKDTKVMRIAADELSVAIQNIQRLEEIRMFADTLEKEVNTATEELRASNHKLLELDATKDEFVSMASHQLRTPLTSIKGYLSMVLEGDVGKITPSQRKLLSEAYVSSERMVHLIGDFLNISRLQTGKFMLERYKVDIGKVVMQEVDSMRTIAATHNIKINSKRPPVMPVLYVDEGKIRQVVMNFIDNAVYYSPDATSIDVRLDVRDGAVSFEVEDRGIGVPKNVQKKLFTKFFRAENARKQRPDGTGIGLYLAKKVIDEHGGSIIFRSTPGKGSTFGFQLPIKKLSLPPGDHPQNLIHD